jgi:hypothetical protein
MKQLAKQLGGYEVSLFGKRFYYFPSPIIARLFLQHVSPIYIAYQIGSSVEVN